MAEVETELKNIEASGAAFISSPALALVGRTAILTPAGKSASSQTPLAAVRTTFTLAAGEVDQRPIQSRGNRVLPVVFGAAAIIGVVILWLMWPGTPKRNTATPSFTNRPTTTVDSVPVHSLPAPVRPARAEAPRFQVELPPVVAPQQPALRAKMPARSGEVSAGLAPATKPNLDALQEVQEGEPKKAPKRRAKNKTTSARAADLDALAE